MQCLLPEHGVFISPEGFLTSCCVSMHDRFGNIKNEHPITIFNGEIASKFRTDFNSGNLPYSCNQCINKEHYNLRTEKTRAIESVKTSNSKIVYADITLGNICQLNCVMCNEVFSHTWAKIKNQPSKIWHITPEKMEEILQLLNGVSFIEIKGGDPFNMPYFKTFLDRLYEINPDVSLMFLTSGVFIHDSQMESLKKFKNFNVGISLEADKELYSYIRGGHHTIDTVFNNLKRLHENNLLTDSFYISSTLSFYNIDTWVEDHVSISNRFENYFGFKPNIAMNIVLMPELQSAFLASQTVREKFYNDLLASDLTINKTSYRHILEDRFNDNLNLEKIKGDIAYFDGIRNMRLLDIKPYLLGNLDERYKLL